MSRTLAAQYIGNNNIDWLINQIEDEFNISLDNQSLLDNFYNIDTATGKWLDIWGRIVALDRVITPINNNFFGFFDTPFKPFNKKSPTAPFFNGNPNNSGAYIMDDDMYRHAIKTKALINISGVDIFSLKRIATYYFDYFNCTVSVFDINNDSALGVMTLKVRVTGTYAESPEAALFCSKGLDFRPASVKLIIKASD